MVMPLAMSLFATNLAYDSAGVMFGANQARMGLADSVTGGESPASAASLQAQDKALTLQGIQAQTNYQVALAMQEAAQNLQKKNEEQRIRMIQNGALFF